MSVPIFGAIFIPIGLCIFLFRPRYLIALMVVSSVFVAASVVDFSVGDSVFGVQPYYFAALLLAIRALPVLFRYRRLRRGSGIGKTVGPLVGFWKWATVSAFIFPVIFKGLEVINPRSVDGDVMAAFVINGETSPLHLSLGNLGQIAYLTLSLVAVLYVVVSERDGRGSGYSLVGLRAAIIVVSVVAVLQSVAAWRGWSFPYSFFSGNPAYLQSFVAESEGVPRVNSTFTEASSAGGFLAAGTLGLLAMRLQAGRVGRVGLSEILLAVTGLILTTATTGYAAFLVGGLLLLIYFAHGSLSKRLPPHVLRRGVYITLLVAVGVAFLLAADPPLREAILAATVYKADTLSFFARISVDLYSLKLLYKTYGLGAGLGSNRPSSLGAALLGNVGIIGTVLFIVFVVRFFVQLLAASRRKGGESSALLAWMMVGLLVAQGMALPDLSWPPLWAVLIAAAGMLTSRICLTTEAGRSVESASVNGRVRTNSALA